MADQAGPDRRALYLRWRSRRFAEIVGQAAVVRTLQNAVSRGTVAHAYLLCGPRGTGKTSLARILFKALNCLRPMAGDACAECAACLASDVGRALDLIEIDAASNRGIDDIRALRERARFAPSESNTKVYIVDEAHQLTQPAWDAFLKTLEEPPPRTVFVLATTAAHKVPATIVSRCQRFDLSRIAQVDIVAHLEHIARVEGFELEPGVAERVARLAHGGMRDALSMIEQLAAFAGSPVTIDAARRVLGLVRGDALQAYVDALAQRDSRRAFLLLEDIAQEGADLRQFLDEVLVYLRAVLLVRMGAEEALATELGVEEKAWIQGVAQRWGTEDVAEVLRAFGEIGTTGLDERQMLVRLELATARALVVATTLPLVPPVAVAPPIIEQAERTMRDPSPAPPVGVVRTPTPVPASSTVVTRPRADLARALPSVLQEGTAIQYGVSSPPPSWDEERLAPLVGAETTLRAPVGTASADPSQKGEPLAAAGVNRPAPVLTLTQIQDRWHSLVERFKGSLAAQILVSQLRPQSLEGQDLSLSGELDAADLKRLDAQHRRAVEAWLEQEIGAGLRVRFVAPSARDGAVHDQRSLPEVAASLFGGQLIDPESETKS